MSGQQRGFPDFYIVGAAKAGTTSLWNYLRDHPQVHLGPIKEPNFFAVGPEGPNVVGPAPAEELRARLHVDTVTDEKRYLALFDDAADGQLTGEASVRYLYNPDAAARIAAARPDARIIVMLRHPIDRLRSHYTMNRSWGLEPLAPAAAIEAEDQRVAQGWGWDWHYVRVGLYAEQVERYLLAFDRRQILIIGYDDFSADPQGAVANVCRHLGVATDHRPDTTIRAKQAYTPRSASLDALRRTGDRLQGLGVGVPPGLRRRAGALLRKVNHQQTEAFDEQTEQRLLERFQPDLSALESLVDRPEPWRSGA